MKKLVAIFISMIMILSVIFIANGLRVSNGYAFVWVVLSLILLSFLVFIVAKKAGGAGRLK